MQQLYFKNLKQEEATRWKKKKSDWDVMKNRAVTGQDAKREEGPIKNNKTKNMMIAKKPGGERGGGFPVWEILVS